MSLYRKLMVMLILGGVITGCAKQEDEPESEPKSEGVVGTSCWVLPVLRDDQGFNVCFTPQSNWPGTSDGEMFYAGIIGILTAEEQAINACIQANALDYGTDLREGGCAQVCRESVNCLVGTNR